MGVIAQREREMIAQRTRDALGAAQRRCAPSRALAAVSRIAAKRAEDLRRDRYHMPPSRRNLTRVKSKRRRSGCWYPSGVARLRRRLAPTRLRHLDLKIDRRVLAAFVLNFAADLLAFIEACHLHALRR